MWAAAGNSNVDVYRLAVERSFEFEIAAAEEGPLNASSLLLPNGDSNFAAPCSRGFAVRYGGEGLVSITSTLAEGIKRPVAEVPDGVVIGLWFGMLDSRGANSSTVIFGTEDKKADSASRCRANRGGFGSSGVSPFIDKTIRCRRPGVHRYSTTPPSKMKTRLGSPWMYSR